MRRIALFFIPLLFAACTAQSKQAPPDFPPFDRAGYYEAYPGMQNDKRFNEVLDTLDKAEADHAPASRIRELTYLLIVAKQMHDEELPETVATQSATPDLAPKDCPSPAVDQAFLTRTWAALIDHKNRSKFISWENDYGNVSHNPANIRVVYVYKGVRYTLWNNPTEIEQADIEGKIVPVTHDGWIAVWERPNGSKGDEFIDTYTDEYFQGCANFGISSDPIRSGEDQRRMLWNSRWGEDAVGIQHHQYWQSRYALAIEGLAATLGVQ